MNIAVSGIKGSFSHQAGTLYATGHQLADAEFVFAVDSEGCFQALTDGKAEVAIVPIHNAIGGVVNMTLTAMGKYLFTIEEYFALNVIQCLMAKPDMQPSLVQRIVSHPQALKQCKSNLAKQFPGVELQEYADTAKAAEDLAAGVIPGTSAVIAPKLSAELYGLDIVEEGLQDQAENPTTFLVIKLSQSTEA